MMDETNQSPFFQDLNEIYKERELLFKQREQDYLKQKIALTRAFLKSLNHWSISTK